MTSNPNPSPELIEQAGYDMLIKHIGINELSPTQMRVCVRAMVEFAALTPPTPAETVTVALPAPGEGENLRARLVAAEHAALKWEQACQQSWDREALATVAAANDEGDWVLVPREITQAMLDATCATDQDDAAMRAAWPELIRTAASPSKASSQTHGKWHVMLLGLVNAIHRDRGVKTQAIGIQASYDQALAAIRILSQGGGK